MDQKLLIVLIVAIFIVNLGFQIFQKNKQNDLLNRLSECLAKKRFDEFDELIDSKQARRSFPVYNRNFLKLNKAFLLEDKKEIAEAFDSFKGLPMNAVQKEALYEKAFYYYLSLKDKENTRAYYDLLKDLNVKDQEMLDVMYDTYILDGYRYLDQIEKQCHEADDTEKIGYCALLADMYCNKGDQNKVKEYEDLLKQLSENLKNKEAV